MNTRRLVGIIFLSLLLFQCTEEPPEPLFQGTAEDSTAIRDLISQMDTMLISVSTFTEGGKVDSTLHGAFYWSEPVAPGWFWDDDTIAPGAEIRIKTHPYEFGRVITTATSTESLVFGIDTTCTVYLLHEFDGNILYQVDRICSLFYQVDPELDPLLDSFKFDSVDFEVSKDLRGNSRQYLFFDLDDQGDWQLEKISFITEFTPQIDSAQSTQYLAVISQTSEDTIYYSQPDPSEPGNEGKRGMNQLVSLDNFVSIPANQDVNFEFHTGVPWLFVLNEKQYRCYFTIDDERVPDSLVTVTSDGIYLMGEFDWNFSQTGTVYLTMEILDAFVGYYSGLADEANYGHYSTIWRIPIEVK